VTVRTRTWLAAALGVCMAHPLAASAADPPRRLEFAAASANQKIADAVADAVRQSGQIRGYSVEISVQCGVAEVSGSVADQPQREEVLRLARGVPGVERVVDHLIMPEGVRRVRDDLPPAAEPPPAAPEPPPHKPVVEATAPAKKAQLALVPPAAPEEVSPPAAVAPAQHVPIARLIEQAASLAELEALLPRIGLQSKMERDALRPAYTLRKKQLLAAAARGVAS
jgi:hypothetical protein